MRIVALLICVLFAGCQGTQQLWVVAENTEPLNVTVGGRRLELELRGLQAFSRLKLGSGAEVVIERAGQQIDSGRVPAVPEGFMAIYFVGGAPTIHPVDYKGLAGIGRKKDRIGPVEAHELEFMSLDRSTKALLIREEAVVVGPEDRLPAGGNVNPRSFEKYPIVRLERVELGADVQQTILDRATHELGFDRLPGQ